MIPLPLIKASVQLFDLQVSLIALIYIFSLSCSSFSFSSSFLSFSSSSNKFFIFSSSEAITKANGQKFPNSSLLHFKFFETTAISIMDFKFIGKTSFPSPFKYSFGIPLQDGNLSITEIFDIFLHLLFSQASHSFFIFLELMAVYGLQSFITSSIHWLKTSSAFIIVFLQFLSVLSIHFLKLSQSTLLFFLERAVVVKIIVKKIFKNFI
eukprot:jgi/Orpsp1_1/1188169/evm.model.d7180000062941.1